MAPTADRLADKTGFKPKVIVRRLLTSLPERSRAVLNPGPLALAEEEEQPELRLKRLTAASLVMRTLGDPLFENYRIAQKAKAPHALHMVKQTL